MKKIAVLLVALLTLGLLAGCGTEKNAEKKLQPLTIGLMPDTDSLPFIIAQEKGYFKEEGLEVNIQQYKSAMDRDSALQSGNLDGAVSDMLAVAFAKDGGFNVKVTSFTDGSYKLIAGKQQHVKTVADLQGQDVAVSRNTIIEYVTDQILAKEKMEPDSINKVIIPQIPTRLEMLQNGKLAAATLPEPMASIAVHNGCQFVTGSDELGINPGVIMFTAKTTNDRRAELAAMYRAYNKAVDYLNNTPREEYINLVVEKGGFPPAAQEALKLPEYHHAALPKESDVVDCVKWLQAKGLIKKNYTYADFVVDVLSQK
ncbi:putative ABC transporter periplasmic substrate-binding protein [Selenomonas ruminantium subsp. lactilytica TAM6421]|uniref:Putative ABC transporter periplasmic substrate-binding protein n=1 Tax=Selenomonas ruminantium subsp. lactilytica (strain NBRC 103574 / TAM6421) TaxID=927704 RepID=I0GQ76_SELRL|nr:MetQ/NlpA family ABC transporter substrate-binding protein [Selenomonas ruminantium]BAL82913.1 putative ABC transporter periplasmic substrate-binding protein [Selenomonas ruminantium subsp. lactilytica TAM6421]